MDEVTQVLFGIDGFRVLDAWTEEVGGDLVVAVETVDPRRGCPGCGVVGHVKERPRVRLRDATSAGRRVRVVWAKRRWACREPDCERASWTEQNEAVGVRRLSTRRCRTQVAKGVTRGRSVTEVADDVGMGGVPRCGRWSRRPSSLTGSGRSAGWVWMRRCRADAAGS